MTPKEIQQALSDLRSSIGPKADVSMNLSDNAGERPIYLSIHPFGICKSEGYLAVRGDDFAATIQEMRDEWAKYSADFREKTLRKMALAVIRLTSELGECTDAALREEFDAGQVAGMGADACELANTMAGKGPFAIKRLRGANAA